MAEVIGDEIGEVSAPVIQDLVWLYHMLFIHLFMDVWVVSTFRLFLTGAIMNICVEGFAWTHVFISFGYMHRNKIARSFGNSI